MGNVRLKMDTNFPDGDTATLSFTMPTAKEFTVALRRPFWAGDGFAIKVNGTATPQPSLTNLRGGAAGGRGNAPGNEGELQQSSSYVELKRMWKSGDTIEITMPKSLRLEPTPDNKSVAAILWGPLVLAGNLGPRREARNAASGTPAPVLVAANRPLADWIQPTGTSGNFVVNDVAKAPANPVANGNVELQPFYRTHRRTYSVYFDVLTPAEFDARAASIAAERERARKLQAATIGFVQPGEMQPERDFNYQSEPAERAVQQTNGRANRSGGGWFSFDLPVDPSTPIAVVVTYLNETGAAPAAGNFQILVDGTAVGRFESNPAATGFFDTQYAVPANLLTGKSKVTIRFQTTGNGRIAPVFGVRTIRTEMLR
jgi:hypothetical protein